MAIKAVIFDMGGVILRTMDHSPREELAVQLGTTRKELEMAVFAGETSLQAEVGAIHESEHWDAVFRKLNIPATDQIEFQNKFWSMDRMDEELLDFIRDLRASYRTGLLSNAWDGIRPVLETRFPGTLESFDVAVFSAEVGMRKPDARYYQWMLDNLGVSAAEAIFIDDYPPNIDGAQMVGLKAIQFHNPDQMRREVLALLNHRAGGDD